MPLRRQRQPKGRRNGGQVVGGVTLRLPSQSTLGLGPRFKGAKAASAISGLARFQRRFPSTKVKFPTEFRVV